MEQKSQLSETVVTELDHIDEEKNSIQESKANFSKNQQKKLLRLEKMQKYKVEKRKKERELRKLKGKVNKCVKENENGDLVEINRKSLKSNLMKDSKSKLRIAIDCSFEDLMNDSDISHLCKQLGYCYAKNRRMESPLQLYFTSCINKTKNIMERSGLTNWDVHLKENHFTDVFSHTSKENICYLTSDSPNELDEFDENKVYIIGGFVDHNHHKMHCFNLAVNAEISHCRLPIGKYMHMKTRQVLTVNQVYEIICKYVECKDWQKAFITVLPKRKDAKLIDDDSKDSDE